ncbi:related to acetate regulatory DNA binding protein FacB [Rhynchosporium secalis]|uniref:Related to acetate regulatory DNA binding protein FacB n=1 Tax=Rhynchosporium secalis TaxID=38038 RepID=A0A1E1ME38_RHYSE|nr:related to acetate regulatory DNA binding protein FacB [Rhynchosporium secalis]
MNVDSAASSGSSGLGGPTSRAQRGAIASQACEMCRSRKQKCDEARPRCGLCNRINVECVYREPQPTKKDKTLTEILNRLMNIEGKIDQISTRRTTQDFGSLRNIPSSQPSFNLESETSSLSTPSSRQQISPTQPYRHASAAHKILSWPALQQLMLQVLPSNAGDFKYLESDGTSFIVRMHSGQPKLPKDEPLQDRPFVGMQSQATRNIGAPRVTFPALTRDAMYRLTAAYFDTFNFLYPFMDRRTFESDTLAKVCSEGFDGDVDSVIALMIFCLGEVAIEGLTGNPIGEYKGLPSGIRGGSDGRPPGLALFNEARKCLGFVLTDSELENVQIFSLFANFLDLDTPRGDLIRRVVWHCIIMETSLHLELDLPLTGILELGDRVGMPSFNVPFCEADHLGNQATNFEAHFASALALRRLGTTINAQIYDSISNTDTPASDEFGGPSATTLKSLAAQLTQWRGLLPRDLQWPEEDPAAFPTPQTGNIGVIDAVDPSLATPRPGRPGSQLFSTDLNSDPMQYRFVYDVQVAMLRTRYYYSKFVVYRPFVYKALHFPEQMTQEDAQGVAECLRTCLKWPLTLSPTSRHKRLIPYLFCWSQTFVSILLIFHLTQHNPMLRDIRAQLCGPRFEEDFEVSVALMQDWIRDLKAVDPLALWCYKILQPIYNLDP